MKTIEKTEKPNILLVDDRPENLLAVEKILRGLDVSIMKALTGNDALSMTLDNDFALILMDVQMPDMDGFETAELIRGNDETKHIPIIFVTAISKDRKHMFKGYEAGAVDYMLKPLDIDILKNKAYIFIEMYNQKRTLERMNEELKKANEKITLQQRAVIEEERLKVLLQMAGATAHELNQPLMTLLGNIELMQMVDDPEKTSRYMAKIREAGEGISATVKKIQKIRYDEIIAHDAKSYIINFNQTVKILSVVETEDDFQVIRNILKKEEWIDTFRALSTKEALGVLKNEMIDIVFLGHRLNDETCFDFLMNLEENEYEIPVVIITEENDAMIASQMIQFGAYEYLSKGNINFDSLSRVINNTMEKVSLKMDLKRARAKVAEMTTIDELTKLSNRTYFRKTLEKEYERVKRHNVDMSLIKIEVDNFKKINNLHGRLAGNMVLYGMGEILKKCKRLNDLAGRYKAEKFVLILPDTSLENAQIVCEKVRKYIQDNKFEYNSKKVAVAVSFSVASAKNATNSDDLLSQVGLVPDKSDYETNEGNLQEKGGKGCFRNLYQSK